MENKKKKCSLNKHSESEAISFCQQCKIYLCNKCQNLHSELYDNHNLISLEQDLNEIFIDICKYEGHNNKLEFFCKKHNTLCCLGCVCKFKVKGYGQHSECDTCYINDIKDEKKNKLKENINHLEELSNKFEKSINELKIIFENIGKEKEELKLKIQKIFIQIRNSLNEKKDKLLLEIDEKFNEIFIKEDIIRESEKLPNKIKISLEKGKLIDKEWNDNNLNSLINNCIDIENNIKKINEINEIINKNHLNKNIKIDFSLNEDEINEFLNKIKNFGKIINIEKAKKNYELYNNFDIKMKNPIHKLNSHTHYVLCLALLNDGRLVSGSYDNTIIIYKKISFKPDLTIKEHKDSVFCIIQLSSGILASCSQDKTIKLFNIKNDNYKLIQTLNYHKDCVYKIIELKNKTLVSCSKDSSIIFYVKDNLEYKKDYSISTDSSCSSIIQTKDNEICYSVKNDNKIFFYDLLNKKNINSISNINKHNGSSEWFIMISKELLLIPGENKISIINVKEYKLVRIIEVSGSSWIYGVCMLNKDMLLTGDYSKVIRQWKIEGDNLILLSKKEKAHDDDINVLLNLEDGHIASGSDDHTIRIW